MGSRRGKACDGVAVERRMPAAFSPLGPEVAEAGADSRLGLRSAL
jgi:hypothetical protein